VTHTSEEQRLAPGVALGRGHLVLDVTQDRLGDLIQSLGTILQQEREGGGQERGEGRSENMYGWNSRLKPPLPHLQRWAARTPLVINSNIKSQLLEPIQQ